MDQRKKEGERERVGDGERERERQNDRQNYRDTETQRIYITRRKSKIGSKEEKETETGASKLNLRGDEHSQWAVE